MTRELKESDFEAYRLVHRAMGREADAIARMIAALADGDRVRPRRLQSWLKFVERTLRRHHVAEDRWFFPLLQRRDAVFAEKRAALEAEHTVLEPLLHGTMRGLGLLSEASGADWTRVRAEVQKSAEAFRDHLLQHLANEEAIVVERSMASLDRMDIETFNRKAFAHHPISDMRMTMPWLLENCSDAERERLIDRLPFATRLVYKLIWHPRFRSISHGLEREV
jgi:hemerythrin-like domain-containing protein